MTQQSNNPTEQGTNDPMEQSETPAVPAAKRQKVGLPLMIRIGVPIILVVSVLTLVVVLAMVGQLSGQLKTTGYNPSGELPDVDLTINPSEEPAETEETEEEDGSPLFVLPHHDGTTSHDGDLSYYPYHESDTSHDGVNTNYMDYSHETTASIDAFIGYSPTP